MFVPHVVWGPLFDREGVRCGFEEVSFLALEGVTVNGCPVEPYEFDSDGFYVG